MILQKTESQGRDEWWGWAGEGEMDLERKQK